MNAIFRDLVVKNIVLTYLDDLIIHADDFETAIRNLEIVLDRASKFGLELNFDKCRFLQTKIEYLGHVIEGGKISPSENKIKAIANFPIPSSIKQVQSFLGLSGYFRKYVPRFSIIARPSYKLLKNDVKLKFEAEKKEAFQMLKNLLCC